VSTCYAVGNAGTVLFTSSRGGGWTAQASHEVNDLYSISCAQTTICLLTGNAGTAAITKDGSTWIDRSFPTANALNSAAFPDTAHAWAVGYGGTILYNPNIVEVCTPPSVSLDHPSPQLAGTQITFTASASGCSAPLYQFWMLAPGSSTWTIAQPYSSNATFTWKTGGLGPGSYTYTVWVRNAGSAGYFCGSLGCFDAYLPATSYTLTTTPCTSVTESVAPASTALAGTAVVFSASAAGCPHALYQFWTLAPGSTSWTIGQAYSSTATFNWNTAGLTAGNYMYTVWVRDTSSTGTSCGGLGCFDAYSPATAYAVTTQPCSSSNETAAPGSPQLSGTSVTFTATASGCPNPLYQFWILAPGSTTWQVAKAYSSSASFAWNTSGLPAGTYRYTVWVRDASSTGTSCGSLGCFDAYAPATGYALTSQPCISVTESAAPTSTATAGTTVVFTASASGCPHPLYQFWILAAGSTTWQIAQAYSTNATFNWSTTGLPAGTYRYTVWVRDSSSSGTNSNSLGTFDAYSPATAYTLT
jgi:hypothetical protein